MKHDYGLYFKLLSEYYGVARPLRNIQLEIVFFDMLNNQRKDFVFFYQIIKKAVFE